MNTVELEARASGWASFRQGAMKGKRKGAAAEEGRGKTSRTRESKPPAARVAHPVRHSVYGLQSEHSRQQRESE